MFKTQVEPRATGEWFHCKVLNILWHHFYGLQECRPWKIIVVDLFLTITFIFFYQKPKTKQPALLDRLLHFHVYTLIDHSSQPISAQGFAQLL